MFRKFKKSKSIFSYLLVSMCVLSVIQAVILAGNMILSGLCSELNQNARDILDQKVINRNSYLQNAMVNNWSQISSLVNNMNETAERLEQQGKIQFQTLDDSSEEAMPLLMASVQKLIATMRSKHVTGAFLILNNEDLDRGLEDKPGLYLRDLDPISKESDQNGDILIERAPVEVVKSFNIATSSSWRPRFEFQKTNTDYYDFFYTPYQQALKNDKDFRASDMGYWGRNSRLEGSKYDTITYSIPLINQEGKAYGVVGIDISIDYLNKILPSSELLENEKGNYMLAVKTKDSSSLKKIMVNGKTYDAGTKEVKLTRSEEEDYIRHKGRMFYASIQYLNIYNNNTPYSNQKWALVGIADTEVLFGFTEQIQRLLILVTCLTLIVGIGGSLIVSYVISKPIKKLTNEVIKTNVRDKIRFDRTKITEIDRFANAIEELNQSVRDTSLKFTNLLQMASVKLAGFEYNEKTGELFLSDNFFEIFLDRDIDTAALNLEQFKRQFATYEKYIVSSDYDNKKYLFKIPDKKSVVYVRLRLIEKDGIHTGVVENVTDTIVEKNIIEFERDHDSLTGLLNRGAFVRTMNDLFQNHKEELKIAALLMFDLDDLKFINDTYGHETGDQYIAKAAEIFSNQTPERTIVSRISGDEFYLFFYGYDTEDTIREIIYRLKLAVRKTSIPLIDQDFYLKVSGGVAWYPRNSESFERLQHFADYAMYKIKHTSKGDVTDFDHDEYLEDSFRSEVKDELKVMIRDKTFQFYFQPIVDGTDGTIFGYESLMRSFVPGLKSPLEILKAAKEEHCSDAIEELTWELSLETFKTHVQNGLAEKEAKIFINSISDQRLQDEKMIELEEKYSDYLKNVVLEVTEWESTDRNYYHHKLEFLKKWGGQMALDDYGSGYNSECMLLSISPQFIKIDMEIIRNIDQDPNKCKMVENIVEYAKERNMKVIAEGIETIDELKQAVNLKVDYLQGFLLAKPNHLPPKVQENVEKLIRYLNQQKE